MAVRLNLPKDASSVGSRLYRIKFKPLMLMRSLGFTSEGQGMLVELKLAARNAECRVRLCVPGECSLPSPESQNLQVNSRLNMRNAGQFNSLAIFKVNTHLVGEH